MSPSPTAEIAQTGRVDRKYRKKEAAPRIRSAQSGVIFGNTPWGSDDIGLIYSTNSGDILD